MPKYEGGNSQSAAAKEKKKQEMEKEKRTKEKIPVILPGRVYGEISIIFVSG